MAGNPWRTYLFFLIWIFFACILGFLSTIISLGFDFVFSLCVFSITVERLVSIITYYISREMLSPSYSTALKQFDIFDILIRYLTDITESSPVAV